MAQPDASLRAAQRGVIRGALAAVSVLGAAAVLIWVAPEALALGDGLATRLRVGAGAALVPALVVAFQAGRIGALRFHDPDAIAGAARDLPGSPVSEARAALTNSVEQAVIAMPVYAALALLLSPARLFAVPLLAALFAIGRAFFVRRYRSGAAARAFGFALTFYPSLAGLAAAVLLVFRGP